MKVKELIEELKMYPEDIEVVFKHPAHDYWKNELVSTIHVIDRDEVEWSDYHSSYVVIDREKERDDDDDEEDKKDVLIISY